jgi:hypothetical protein
MENGIEALGAIRSQLQGRDDVLAHSLELLEHEREIIRRELGLIEELVTAEQQRVAMQAVPTTAAAPEPETTTETVLAVEPEPEPVPTAQVEPEPALMAEAAPELASVEAPNALRLQHDEKIQRLRESLLTGMLVPDPVPPRAANAGLFEGLGRF